MPAVSLSSLKMRNAIPLDDYEDDTIENLEKLEKLEKLANLEEEYIEDITMDELTYLSTFRITIVL